MFFRQERIDHGELIRWTKGINVANTEGRDVAAMFAKSLEKYVRKKNRHFHHEPLIFHVLNTNSIF